MHCTSCGHELGVGRFCTHCGQAVDRPAPRPAAAPYDDSRDPADTTERRAARRRAALEPMPPRTPPAAADRPRAPRYPLFADEVTEPTATTATYHLPAVDQGGLLDRLTATPAAPGPHGDADRFDPVEDQPDGRSRRPLRVLLLVLLLGTVLVAAVLGWRAVRDPGGASDGATTAAGTGAGAGSEPVDLVAGASASVPGTAPPATGVGGGRATFVAENLLDGDPATAWRVAGSAAGAEIVLRLPAPARVSQVGLVNGDVTRATDAEGRSFDSYLGNRRIDAVTWVLGPGVQVDQTLGRSRRLQLIDVDPVTTATITLRLRTVGEPGDGPAGRDFTAISDLAVRGTPAS